MGKSQERLKEQLSRARRRTERLVDHVRSLLLNREANAIVLYSPVLAEQIPKSRAARAFNQFRESMALFELVRLFAVWEKPSGQRESIPEIIELVNRPDVLELVAAGARARFGDLLGEDRRVEHDGVGLVNEKKRANVVHQPLRSAPRS